MKILLTTDLSMPAVNGVVISVWNLYGELKKNNDVKILTLSNSKHSYREGDIYYIKAMKTGVHESAFISMRIYDKYIDELIEWKPDIIHSNCEFSTYTFADKIKKETGAPIVHTYHTMYEHYIHYIIKHGADFGKKILYPFMRSRLKTASLIIAPTEKVKKALVNNKIDKPIKVVPSGIDLSEFNKILKIEEKEEIKEKLAIPKDAFILGSLGRIAEEKNFSESLRIFKKVLIKSSNIYYIIVGGGDYLDELKDEAKKLDIEEKVIFTGMVSPTEVYKYYQTFDIFLASTVSETQGLTYIEALSNKCALVVRRDEAIDGIIEHNYNGFIYDEENEACEYINRLVENEDLLNEIKNNADKSKYSFSKEKFGERIYSIYQEVLNKTSS